MPIRRAFLGILLCVAACTPAPKPAADPLTPALAAAMSSFTVYDQVRAIIVSVDGKPRFERYFGTTAAASRSSFSVTKSIMSMLVGIAIGEGRLHLEDRLDRMLPQHAAAMPPHVAAVTLRQLLTMTGGFTDTWNLPEDPMLAAPDWTRFILAHQEQPPGREFHYSDHDAHLLSPILAQATGQTVLAYARAKLFDPLGIVTTPAEESVPLDEARVAAYLRAPFAWPADPQGFHIGAAWIKLTPPDMAKFGALFLQGGRWAGRQIVPAEWVRESTTSQAGAAFGFGPQDEFAPDNYGYLWWVDSVGGDAAYLALGYGGQLIEVVPARRLVIVVSTEVSLTDEHAPAASPADIQRLVAVIVQEVRGRAS